MKNPLVSVIVPVYNGERYLDAALQSIFRQDYRPFEVIVVDDGSTDRSAHIARACPEIRYMYQCNQGVASARNAGIAAARGDFIAFLDQDDFWATNKLTVQIDFLLDHPDVGYVLSRQRLFLEPGVPPPPWFRKNLLLEDQTGYCPGTLLVRRIVFERIGLFDPGYKHSSDADWFARAKDGGIPMRVLPQVLLYTRIHGRNSSAETQILHGELLKALKASIDRRQQQKSDRSQEK